MCAGCVGVWLCVKAYGGAYSQGPTFSLRAKATVCPSSFDDEGRLTECSTRVGAPESERHSSACTLEGNCVCKAPYQKPVPTVYPGPPGSNPHAVLRIVMISCRLL